MGDYHPACVCGRAARVTGRVREKERETQREAEEVKNIHLVKTEKRKDKNLMIMSQIVLLYFVN